MSYPPHAPPPEDQRPSWYTPAPEPTGRPHQQRQPRQPPAPLPAPPPPPHWSEQHSAEQHWSEQPHRPAQTYRPGALKDTLRDPERKPHSPALATVGWILTVVFGLLFILFFVAGVEAFNSNVTEGEHAYNVGVFLGFFIILLLPAIPILLGIRLIRQPRRRPRIR